MLDDPYIGSRLGCKRDHHHRIHPRNDNLDPKSFATIERNDPILRIGMNVCVAHAGNMACRMPIRNPASKNGKFQTAPLLADKPPSRNPTRMTAKSHGAIFARAR